MRRFYGYNKDFCHYIILGLLILVGTLPFIHHAFHIDEPVFIKVANQIKEHPFDPYGFRYNWANEARPAHQFIASPPFFSYLLALVSWGTFWPSEARVHLSLIPLSLLAAFSFYYLLRQEDFSPRLSLLGAIMFIASPSFIVTSNLAMPDVTAVSLALFSLVLGRKGWIKGSTALLILSGIFLGFSVLTRFNALPILACFPLLGYYWKGGKKSLIPSFVAAGLFLLWILWSRHLYGHNQFSFIAHSEFFRTQNFMERFLALNTHLTLSTFIPFFAFLIFFKKYKSFSWVFTILFAWTVFLFSNSWNLPGFKLYPDLIFAALGFFCLVFLLFSNRNFSKLPFQLWVVGTLAVPLVYVFFASKYLVLTQPALIFLLLKLVKPQESFFFRISLPWTPWIFIIALLVARADFSLANTYRLASERIYKVSRRLNSGKLWVRGHWGFQYYLEKKGAHALPILEEYNGILSKGDLIATASFPIPAYLPEILIKSLDPVYLATYPDPFPVRTMNINSRAGFYGSPFGNLPFSISREDLEKINLYQVTSLPGPTHR